MAQSRSWAPAQCAQPGRRAASGDQTIAFSQASATRPSPAPPGPRQRRARTTPPPAGAYHMKKPPAAPPAPEAAGAAVPRGLRTRRRRGGSGAVRRAAARVLNSEHGPAPVYGERALPPSTRCPPASSDILSQRRVAPPPHWRDPVRRAIPSPSPPRPSPHHQGPLLTTHPALRPTAASAPPPASEPQIRSPAPQNRRSPPPLSLPSSDDIPRRPGRPTQEPTRTTDASPPALTAGRI
jgi:hypothetical protein